HPFRMVRHAFPRPAAEPRLRGGSPSDPKLPGQVKERRRQIPVVSGPQRVPLRVLVAIEGGPRRAIKRRTRHLVVFPFVPQEAVPNAQDCEPVLRALISPPLAYLIGEPCRPVRPLPRHHSAPMLAQ